LQKEGLNSLYTVVKDYIPESHVKKNNKRKSWAYGYNKEHEVIVISKDGTIGDVVYISGLYIALPSSPQRVSSHETTLIGKDKSILNH
jgi:hypothetical protein